MRALFILLVLFATVPSHQLAAFPQQKKKPQKVEKKNKKPSFEFIRIRKEGRRIQAMETNVVRYAESIKYPGAYVDLIGAIHLADPEYYDELNKLFEEYDVLLYEAVKDEGAEIGQRNAQPLKDKEGNELSPDTQVGLSVVGTLQLGMKDVLGLEYQMTGVDYRKKNFVHADMTTREFQKSMADRGESFAGMLIKEMGKSVGKESGNPLAQQLDLMLSSLMSDRQIRMRRIFAKQLASHGAEEAFSDSNGESTIITERNKKALQVLEEQLKKGHKKIGIFYGAAHMPDMDRRLTEEFYLKRGKPRWMPAWKLRTKSKAAKKVKAEAK